MLSFQKLDVYQCSIQFLALATEIIERLPRGSSVLVDQLRRSSLSSPLNIAEGAGRPSPADASRHYGIARGSAMESAAVVDALRVLHHIDEATYDRAIDLLERVVAMLTRMVQLS